MKKVQNPQITKFSVIVAVCIVAMIGLILGIIFSTKLSVFRTESDEYILKNDYKLTQEDIDAIGLGNNSLGLTHACCINLNGHSLDLNGYDFSVIAGESGMITFKNGTIKGGGTLTVKGNGCDVNFDNVKLSCDYSINTVNSGLFLTKTDADTSRFTAEGGRLVLNGSSISGALNLKSDLEAYGSSLESVSATDVTASVKGEVGCVFSAGLKAQIKIFAAVNDVEAEQGSKVTIAKEQGGNDYKGGNVDVLNAKGGKVIVENCGNVNSLNVKGNSVIDMSGTANELNIESDSNITVNKCAIIDNVNVNSATTLAYAGTASAFNLNKANKVDVKATAYIKQLLVAEAAAESEIAFNGQAAYIALGSENVKFDAKRDAKITLIKALSDTYFAGDKFTYSIYSLIGEKAAAEDAQKINEAKSSFIMPIFYINSDCKGDGFIKFSAGGNKADTNPSIEYLAQIGHEYEYSVIMRSTDKEHGIGRYTCKDCGEFYDKQLPLRKIVLDTPTLFDLFGLNVKNGTYSFGLNDELFVLNDSQFVREAKSASEEETYTIVIVEKAFIDATVVNSRSDFNVKVYGNAELKFAAYSEVTKDQFSKITAIVSAAKAAPEESVIEKLMADEDVPEEDMDMDIKAYMEGSEIYFTFGESKYVLGLYDLLNEYLMMGTDMLENYISMFTDETIYLEAITVDDLVNSINGLIKSGVLLERYEPALKLLFNVIGNGTIFSSILPDLDIATEKDGVYSVNTDDLFNALTLFGEQSLAEYIDSVFGRGTVSAVLDLVKNVYDLTVGEIYDYTVMLASNLEKDEVDVLEDLDTIISILVDNVNDIVSETDRENILGVLDKFFREDNYIAIETPEGTKVDENEVYYTFDAAEQEYVITEIEEFEANVQYYIDKYTYSFANCVNNYENLTIYQIMYGENDGSQDYIDDKKAAENEIESLVASIEGILYEYLVDEAFGMVAIPLTPYYDIISEMIFGEITWTVNAENKLAQFGFTVDKKPTASSDSEGPAEDLNMFTLAYDAENNKITKISADIEVGPVYIFGSDTEDKCYLDIAYSGMFEFEIDINKNLSSEAKLDFSLDNFPTVIDILQYILDKCSSLNAELNLPFFNDMSLYLVKGGFEQVDTTTAVFSAEEVYFTRNDTDHIYEISEDDEFVAETDYFVIDTAKNMYSILYSMDEYYNEVFINLPKEEKDKMDITVGFGDFDLFIPVEDAYIVEEGKNIGQQIYICWNDDIAAKYATVIDAAIIYNNPVISVSGAFTEYDECGSVSGKTIEEFINDNKEKASHSEGIELTVDTDKIEGSFKIIDYGDKPFITLDASKHEIIFKEYKSSGDVRRLADVKYDADNKEFTISYEEGTSKYFGGVSITEKDDATVYDITIDADTYNLLRDYIRMILPFPLPTTGDNETADFQVTAFHENIADAKKFCGIAAKAFFNEENVAGFALKNTKKDGFTFEVGRFEAKEGYVPAAGENVFNKYEMDPIASVEFSEGHAKLYVNYAPVKVTAMYNKGGFTGIDVEVLADSVRFMVDTENDLCDIYIDLPFMPAVGLTVDEKDGVKTLTTSLSGTEYAYTMTKTAENTFSLVNGSEKYVLTFKASYNEKGNMTGLSIKATTDDENKTLLYEGTIDFVKAENRCELSVAFKAIDTQIEGTLYFAYSDKEGDSVVLVGESDLFKDRDDLTVFNYFFN
ncbi:MAG: hypothetical protein MJ068_03945 [Clostridia bacterium]|nr:hypothetical protein [Clostridia bacterium]